MGTKAATRGVLKKDVLKKFCNIHRKTPALESFSNNVTGLRPATLSEKKDSNTGVFL